MKYGSVKGGKENSQSMTTVKVVFYICIIKSVSYSIVCRLVILAYNIILPSSYLITCRAIY